MANASNENYPPCDNPECDYTLCFMERRDWDECPSCDFPIPINLRLNDDMTGPSVGVTYITDGVSSLTVG